MGTEYAYRAVHLAVVRRSFVDRGGRLLSTVHIKASSLHGGSYKQNLFATTCRATLVRSQEPQPIK